jgi:hypothetical protein
MSLMSLPRGLCGTDSDIWGGKLKLMNPLLSVNSDI